jgi:hypothetical protein
MKKVSLLAASVAFALTGCGSDGDSSGAAPGGVVITAIDGYLQHAEVWVDTDGNFELDASDKKLDVETDEDGQFTLPNEYKDSVVFIKAIKNKTIDKTRGLVTNNFELATTAGATIINPMTNMVVEQLEAAKAIGTELTQEQAEEKVVKSVTDSGLTASEELIFGDYLAEDSDGAKALNAIGETLVDHSDLPVEKQLELTDAIADEAQIIIEDPTQELDDFSPVVDVPADPQQPITVTPNNRPVHDQADDRLDTITLDQGGNWSALDVSNHFSDADTADTLTFELKEITGAKNSNLTINATTGLITTTDGSGVLNGAGTFLYQIFAEDNHGALSYPLNLTVKVVAPNQAPEADESVRAELQEQVYAWTITSQEELTETLTISGLFSDIDGDALTYSVRTSLEKNKDNQDSGFTASIDSNDIISFNGVVPHTAIKDAESLYVYASDGVNPDEIVTFKLPEIKEGATTPPPSGEHPLIGKTLYLVETPEDNDPLNYCQTFRLEDGNVFFGSETYSGDLTKSCAPASTTPGATYTINGDIITINEPGYDPMTFEVKHTSETNISTRYIVNSVEKDSDGSDYYSAFEASTSAGEIEGRINAFSTETVENIAQLTTLYIEGEYVDLYITPQMRNKNDGGNDGIADADLFIDNPNGDITCPALQASFDYGFFGEEYANFTEGQNCWTKEENGVKYVSLDFDYNSQFTDESVHRIHLGALTDELPSFNMNIQYIGDSSYE